MAETSAPARSTVRLDLIACILIVISAVVAYIPAIGATPMLDEQYLFTWAKHAGSHSVPWGGFAGFSGFYPLDFWGPLTTLSLKLSALLSFGALWLWRLHNLGLHILSSLCLYFVLARLYPLRAAAIAGGVLFAVMTLNAQAVAWLGGRGAELSGLFLIAGLLLYLKSRNVLGGRYGAWSVQSAWPFLLGAGVLFGCALFSSAAVAPFLLLGLLIEAVLWWRTPAERKGAGTFCIVAALAPLVMATVYGAAVAMLAPSVDLRFAAAHHLMYIPAMLFASLIAGTLLNPRLSRILYVGIAVVCLISGFFVWRTWKQVGVYNKNGKYLRRMQNSISVVGQKTNQPYVVAGGMVPYTGIAPGFYALPSALVDAKSMLVASDKISGGRLKDVLHAGGMNGTVVHWEAGLNSFVETDIGAGAAVQRPYDDVTLDAVGVADLFDPPIQYYKTASLDTAAGELVMDSNSPNTGPIMRLKGDPKWITPLGADYVWIDVQIDAPRTNVDPSIEFYWQTNAAPQIDPKTRLVKTPVVLSDGKFHRYYLPLRTVGFVTSGQPIEVTIGFPAGAKVRIKGMGTVSGAKLMPKFSVLIDGNRNVIWPPNYRFPTVPALGLHVLDRGMTSIPVSFDCSNVEGAAGALIEVSLPDRDFGNDNGSRLSGQTYRTIPVDGAVATSHGIPIEDWTEPGVYAIRAVAMDKGHNMLGNFSDTAYVYVPIPKRSGWSTR